VIQLTVDNEQLTVTEDPDFTKVTAAERASIEESEAAFLRGEFVRAEDL